MIIGTPVCSETSTVLHFPQTSRSLNSAGSMSVPPEAQDLWQSLRLRQRGRILDSVPR